MRAVNEIAVYDHEIATCMAKLADGKVTILIDERPAEASGLGDSTGERRDEVVARASLLTRIWDTNKRVLSYIYH